MSIAGKVAARPKDGPTDKRSKPRSSGRAASFLRVANGTGKSLGMELDFAFLAKAAETSDEGLVSLIGGGFDGIAVEKFPAVVPPFSIVTRFSAKRNEIVEKHTISFEIVTPEGKINRVVDSSKIEFTPVDFEDRASHATGVVQIGFKFDVAGRYQIRIFTDDHLARTLDLYVIQTSKPDKAEK